MSTPAHIRIRPMHPEEWPAVRTIYQEGIDTGQATFEIRAPDWDRWHATHHTSCRLVARFDGAVIGWAALSPVSKRAVYAGVAEVSVYVATVCHGRGIGRALLEALVAASEAAGFWTLQAGVFPENLASLALHRSCDFRIVGRREKLGRHHGVWRDVLFLERRSHEVGRK